ncbi:MAG: hypothetical protein ACYDH9_18660 [Limisphaerales bacterium]
MPRNPAATEPAIRRSGLLEGLWDGRRLGVQISNLLCRRFLIGQASDAKQAGVIGWSVSGLETCDTAQRGNETKTERRLAAGFARFFVESRLQVVARVPIGNIVAAGNDSRRY